MAALLAAGVGYYAGLVVGIATLGLSGGADVAPLTTLAVGGLVVGLVLGLFDGRHHLLERIALGLGLGLAIGLAAWWLDPVLEWYLAALVLLSQGLAWHSWSSASA